MSCNKMLSADDTSTYMYYKLYSKCFSKIYIHICIFFFFFRGGCLHFSCMNCGFEFCYGCDQPYVRSQKFGLYAQHSRNCLSYLRDKTPDELKNLLNMNGIYIETDSFFIALLKENTDSSRYNKCPVQIEEEIDGFFIDTVCNSNTELIHAGLCR